MSGDGEEYRCCVNKKRVAMINLEVTFKDKLLAVYTRHLEEVPTFFLL